MAAIVLEKLELSIDRSRDCQFPLRIGFNTGDYQGQSLDYAHFFYVQRETDGTDESLLCSVMNGQTLVYVGCFYHARYTCLFDRREKKKRSCP